MFPAFWACDAIKKTLGPVTSSMDENIFSYTICEVTIVSFLHKRTLDISVK